MLSRIAGVVALALIQVGAVFGATHQVQVFSFGYDPKLPHHPARRHRDLDQRRWLAQCEGGRRQLRQQRRREQLDLFAHFPQCRRVGYYCEPHGGMPGGSGMAGKITVAGGAPAFPINFGIGGTWFNPATSARGSCSR